MTATLRPLCIAPCAGPRRLRAYFADSCEGDHLPAAGAGSDGAYESGNPLMFDASTSSDSDGSVMEYWFNFGDGERAQLPGGKPRNDEIRFSVRDDCGVFSRFWNGGRVTLG